MSNESHPSPTGSTSSSLLGLEQFESSSPTPDWGKPVTTNNSNANGWSHFQQQQNTNNPSRSNAMGSNNTSSNQWPEMNNFYGNTASAGGTFNLTQDSNENMNTNSASSAWQDAALPLPGNAGDTITISSNNNAGSVINKHKSSSASSMAASLNVALKTAIAYGGANVDPSSVGADIAIVTVPQPRLVEQLGWDEPEIKIAKRANFDDGTSIWGDPMESVGVPVNKWTNGTKTALTNSTNLVLQQSQSSIVQKPAPGTSIVSGSNPTPVASQIGLNDENWPKQQAPTSSNQSSSQWSEAGVSNDQMSTSSSSQKQTNYRSQQSTGSAWDRQSQNSSHNVPDDWFGAGVVDTSDWGLPNSQAKATFDPYEGKVDTSDWAVPGGGAASGMSGPMGMSSMNRNRYPNDYDINEASNESHGIHRMSSFENSTANDSYRQGGDLKNPIIGMGGLLPSSGNSSMPNHMIQSSQLPFGTRPGSMYPSNSILRPINPNGIPTQSGAIMGTGGLISPKLSTTSPVPNQAPYVPLVAKQSNMNSQGSQMPTPQSQQIGSSATGSLNNGAVHAQIMQQFRLAVQAGLISQDLLNTKLPPIMLQYLQKLFELQQKFQTLSIQLADFSKHKQRFPITFFQTEYERLSKLLAQKKHEMLIVQKQIQDAHTKLKQQQSSASNSTPSQMMVNGPGPGQIQSSSGVGSNQSQDQLADRMQHSLAVDHSRLHQWTKQPSGRSGQTSMFAPPGLSQKDWQTSNNSSNEGWENAPGNDGNNSNPGASMDSHMHNNQGVSSVFPDPLADLVDDADGPPPFVPGQLWNWKSASNTADEDPHVTPSSMNLGLKGPSSSMNNLNVGGGDSAFSNPQLHNMQRHQQQQAMRSQWQQASLQEQQSFQPSINDWSKNQQYRGSSKPSSSLNHPPPSHSGFGGYRPFMQ